MATKRNKPGPKNKIGDAERQRVLDIVGLGASLRDAADIIGVGYRTLFRERKRNPQFGKGVVAAVKEGKLKLIQKVSNADAWQAAAWMLERKWGAEYGKKLDVSSGGKPVSFTLNLGNADGSDEAGDD